MAAGKEEIGNLAYLLCFFPSHFGRIDNENA